MTELLILIKLLVDVGLLVLILMVQLTIYPSFLYYKRENLLRWHKKYTNAIAIIVGPLMVAQLFLSIYFVFGAQQYFIGGLHLFFVLATWISTAVQFVPIHNRIANNTHSEKDLKNLVSRNWVRVVLWASIIILDFLQYSLYSHT